MTSFAVQPAADHPVLCGVRGKQLRGTVEVAPSGIYLLGAKTSSA